jgi:hypothetical protein
MFFKRERPPIRVLSFNKLRRRVSYGHKGDRSLVVQIERHNDRTFYIVLLAAFTAAFIYLSYILVSPLFRTASSRDAIYLLPFIAFILAWYVTGIRLAVWRAFGVEYIAVENGVLHWKRTALFWTRELDIPTKDIAGVDAVVPWHSLSNHVEFTANEKRQKIGDMLLSDESCELAEVLRRTVATSG